MKTMVVVKIVWRLALGGGLAYLAFVLVSPQLHEASLTASTVMGVALMAVSASILAGAFD